MMVAGVGMQFFNNYANNKKNAELQAKQREYQIASADHDFERMRRIQAESARIALEMEAELHQERMTDINNQYDNLLENFSHGFSISNWPLNVLPFIMKGESFGSLINGTSNSINMHCILTPSNCEWFNEIFYDDLDLRLEAEMNNHWNAQSSHPLVYYGGGWNRRTTKKGFSFPEQIDLNDIDLLKVNLRNVPMMVITPYFDPWLHFRVELWGMGKESSVPFRIDVPHGDIDYNTRVFSYDYNKEKKEEIYEDDFQNVTIEEFVPYLERLIGFVADKYFWNMYGRIPLLPSICEQEHHIEYDSKKSDYFKLLFEQTDKFSITKHGTRKIADFINELVVPDDFSNQNELVVQLLCFVCNLRLGEEICNESNITEYLTIGSFVYEDLYFLKCMSDLLDSEEDKYIQTIKNALSKLQDEIKEIKENEIHSHYTYLSLHDLLRDITSRCNVEYSSIVIEFKKGSSIISYYFENDGVNEYGNIKSPRTNLYTEAFLVPTEVKQKNPDLIRIRHSKIRSYLDKIAFDCCENIFPKVLSLKEIIKYCKEVIEDVECCDLFYKEAIHADVLKTIDSNLVPNLLYCKIYGRNNETKSHLFYFDSLDLELESDLSINNQITLK